MKEFSKNSICIKCGSGKVATKFYKSSQYIPTNGEQEMSREEIMLRTCRRCGYAWCERPLGGATDEA